MEYTREKLLGKNQAELKEIVTGLGLPGFTAKQIMQWIYRKGVSDIEEMTNLSLKARKLLATHFHIGHMPHVARQCSVDGTIKYLFPTSIGTETVECVYIPDGERATLCVSSQVGCRMGCRFCLTGRQGFRGNLTAGDILNQVYALPERENLTNIVFMGQGEPLDNLDEVLRATELLMEPMGWAWSPKRITVSTVGVRNGLRRFLDESPCHLALSLHNPFPVERKEMMPAENGYGISEIIQMLRQFDWSHQRRISFEYIVFTSVNDSERHARELVRLLAQLECRVNLIRFHEIPDSPYTTTNEERITWLRDYLSKHGITTTIRASRGQDIWAACGLLNTKYKHNEHA